jgi:hypothetical protein
MAELRSRLALFGMPMVTIGATGSGIILAPSMIASALPSPWLILIVWAVGGSMSLDGLSGTGTDGGDTRFFRCSS